MGLTFIEATVTGPSGKQERLEFLIDSGAGYTLLPQEVWQRLGLEPKRKMTFTLADGTHLERYVSECYIALDGAEGHTPVILGEADDDPLLGIITLENLGLMLDPFKRTLRTLQGRLA